MYIKFTESPTGKFSLAYSKGETGFVEDEMGKEVLKAGYGEKVPEPKGTEEKPENRADKSIKETR